MSYSSIASMAESTSLRRRLVACAADESKPSPESFISTRIWQIVISPGWDMAWDSALAGGVGNPGAAEDVITDAMILAVVQPLT